MSYKKRDEKNAKLISSFSKDDNFWCYMAVYKIIESDCSSSAFYIWLMMLYKRLSGTIGHDGTLLNIQ